MSRLVHQLIRLLQRLGTATHRKRPAHIALALRGETEACFYLRQQGYRMVATNFRAPHDRGEIDLIGWDGDVLCFVEVKTRTDASFAPPSTAVTLQKQRKIQSVAKRYLRHLSHRPTCRFDILSVVPGAVDGVMQFTLRKGAFTWERRSRGRATGYYGATWYRRK